jgi:hypothetical protein
MIKVTISPNDLLQFGNGMVVFYTNVGGFIGVFTIPSLGEIVFVPDEAVSVSNFMTLYPGAKEAKDIL